MALNLHGVYKTLLWGMVDFDYAHFLHRVK